jgi:hypothetical protein
MIYTTDYKEVFQILESVVKTLFPIDWMGFYTFGQSEDAYNIVTNPGLPFDWDKKYAEILPYDELRVQAMRRPIGSSCVFSPDNYLISEEGAYCYEIIKKYTDTSQFLSLHTAKTTTVDSGIAFYRTDERFDFSKNDQEILEYLSPFLVSMSQTLILYTESDLRRTTLETFCKNRETLYFCLDNALNPIDLPRETQTFFKRYFTRSKCKTAAHTFTVTDAIAAQGDGGASAILDLSVTQRAWTTDNTTGMSVCAAFPGTDTSTAVTLTATTVTSDNLELLNSLISDEDEEILSAWHFSTEGYTVSADTPVHLSLYAGSAKDLSRLSIWHLEDGEWTKYEAQDLTFDGTYARFVATSFSGYAVTAAVDNSCVGDLDNDGDADGEDLFSFISTENELTMEDFASVFGKNDGSETTE